MRRGLISRSKVELPDAVLDARLARVRAAMDAASLDALADVAACQTLGPLAPAAVTEIDQWLAMLRRALSANYDRLDDVLAAMKTAE